MQTKSWRKAGKPLLQGKERPPLAKAKKRHCRHEAG